MTETALYARWARYYDLLHSFKDYPGEADRISKVVKEVHPGATSLLDVACGTGQHLRYLDASLTPTGVDANQAFLDILAAHSPACATHCALMQEFELGTCFDVVTCLFSSIGFVQTVDGLRKTMRNFAAHMKPGGILLLEPWFSLENFWVGKVAAHFVDLPELKIAWIYNTSVADGMSVLDNRFLVGTGEQLEEFHEKHVLGLFSPQQYVAAIEEAGLGLVEYLGPEQSWKRGLYVARLPAD